MGLIGGIAGARGAAAGGSGGPTQAGGREVNTAGITVSDSGTDVGDGVTRLDFGGALSPTLENDDATSVQIQQQSTNPHVVDVREDLGVQPEQDDLWAAISDHYHSFSPTNRNHLYAVPAGTWYVESDNLDLPAHEFFGLVGNPHARLKVNHQRVDRMMTVGRVNPSLPHAQRTVMRDLRIDIRGEYDTGIARWYTYGHGCIENVRLYGRRNRSAAYGGDLHTIMVDGVTSDTTNIIRNCHLTGGDTYVGPEGPYALAFSSEINNRGTNIWEGCHVAEFLTSAFYASANSGVNIFNACHARNFGGAGFRLGTDDHLNNCRITMTEHPGRPWSGLWLERGSGQVVDGLRVINSVKKDTELLRLTQDGMANVSNVRITDNGTDGRAIRVADSDDARTVFEQCSITDRTSPQISDYAVYVRSSNVTFRDCHFDIESQTDVDRHGVFLNRLGTNVDRLTLNSCDIDTDGASLRFGESGRAHNVTDSFFEGLVMSDADTTLSDVLWVGNRHRGRTIFHGQRPNWKGDFNFGFEVESPA